jgi:hypothetical protein
MRCDLQVTRKIRTKKTATMMRVAKKGLKPQVNAAMRQQQVLVIIHMVLLFGFAGDEEDGSEDEEREQDDHRAESPAPSVSSDQRQVPRPAQDVQDGRQEVRSSQLSMPESVGPESNQDPPLVPLSRKQSARVRTLRQTGPASGAVPHLSDIDQEDFTGIRVSAVPARRQKKMDKASDMITVPLCPINGSPVFQVPNYKDSSRYLPTVTMLVSILSHQHQLRETCFLEGKWKAEAEVGAGGVIPLLEVQVVELVKNVVYGTRGRQTIKGDKGKAGNVESLVSGSPSEVDRADVASFVGQYLEKTCLRVAAVENFSANRWESITTETTVQFIVVTDPCEVPMTADHFHRPHASWKLVFAAESGRDPKKRTPPNFAFANVNPEKTLWTTVKEGNEKRGLLPGDLLPTLRAADILIYQRVVNTKEVYRGKMINFLGQQTKVCCAVHKSPLVKMGRLEETCSRSTCQSKASYRCRELDELRNECPISLCTKHFKEADGRPGHEVLVEWQSRAPPTAPQSTYRVTVTAPAVEDEEEGTEDTAQAPVFNASDEVGGAVMTAREAQALQDFVERLNGAVGDGEGLVCEMSPDAENPLSALFPNPDRQQGMFLLNW